MVKNKSPGKKAYLDSATLSIYDFDAHLLIAFTAQLSIIEICRARLSRTKRVVKSMELLTKLVSSRLRIIILLTSCVFAGLVLYLFHLQIHHMQLFFRLSQKNFLRQEKIASPRGNIVDARGTLLATNRPVYTVHWQGTGEKKLTNDQMELITALSTLLSLSGDSITVIKQAERRNTRAKLVTDISFDKLMQLLERYPHDKNIFLEKSYKRFYPHNNLACHIVGYLGLNSEDTGKMGLELSCNKALRGQSGKIVKIINSIGRHIEAHKVSAGTAGRTLHTTLDVDLQKAAEEYFPADYEGCCLCMDETGALEVMLSRPSFDPNIFLQPLGVADWQKLQEKKGFLNRAFSACYPPASLFKLATLAAALETGIISPSMRFHCIGHTDFKGRLYHCNNKTGHGVLSTEQALAHSCNIPFYEIGKKIKIDSLADYAHRLGLGVKTGLLLPEKTGLIPTREWKRRVKKEPWWPGETLSAAIGQSYMLITPIQVTTMISAINTGYRVQPRILVDEPIVKEPLELGQPTQEFLRQCLRSVIKQGTGTLLKQLPHFTINGKTGTAQTCALEKISLTDKKTLPHGYFVAHFHYKDEKPRTLMIFIEHAGSSSVAIRVAYKFLRKYAQLVDERNLQK